MHANLLHLKETTHRSDKIMKTFKSSCPFEIRTNLCFSPPKHYALFAVIVKILQKHSNGDTVVQP